MKATFTLLMWLFRIGAVFCLAGCVTTTTRVTATDGTVTETTTTTPIPGLVEAGAIVATKKIIDEK